MSLIGMIEAVQLHRHQGRHIPAVLVDDDHRCTFCGHRLTVNGVPPVESRKRPVRTWIPELVNRKRAMAQLAGHHRPEKAVQ